MAKHIAHKPHAEEDIKLTLQVLFVIGSFIMLALLFAFGIQGLVS